MGINVESMSWKGDVASGIDIGVPTAVGGKSYGDYIAFQMKPETIQRRDVFFSPQDYGAGPSRYPKYTAYAKSIGQAGIWTPPSHQSRMTHVRNGLGRTDNEAVFRYELNGNDWDSIHAEPSVYDETLKIVNAAKRKGTLPKHIKVIKASGGLKSSVQQRAKDLREGRA